MTGKADARCFMVKVWEKLKATPRFVWSKRSFIKRRMIIYLIILMMVAPVAFVFRTQIYSMFLLRHDEYVFYKDANGLPVTDYGVQAGFYVGPKITPRAVANSAIEYYEQLEGNSTIGEYFNNTINWLLDHLTTITVPTVNGSIEIIHWYHDFAIWDLPVGWYQSMADAKALHALALAYDLYGNESFIELAEKITASFNVSIRLGGNLYILEDGTSWYPEYIIPNEIQPDYEPKLILNGFLTLATLINSNSIGLNCRRT
ncbi:MAG: D-glucuronyl C5-epimerase family protein, partial [Candidatus Hodarchaeota archaeon]